LPLKIEKRKVNILTKYCSKCGKNSDDDATFCGDCGERLTGLHTTVINDNENNDKNKEKLLMGVAVVLVIAIAIVGAFAFISWNSNEGTNLGDTANNNPNLNNNVATVTSSSIPLSEVYGLAVALDKKAQSQDLVLISSVDYKGVTFTKPQCLYIFTKAIDMKSRGESGNINFRSFSPPDDPLRSINTRYISQSEYVDMAQRTVAWMDNNGKAPNYTGIFAAGSPDVGYDYLVALFALIIIESKNGSLVSHVSF